MRPRCMTVSSFVGAALLLAASIGQTQQRAGETALTIYSTTQPGAVPADLYRPVPGQGGYTADAVPGYAMIRQVRSIELTQGVNRVNFHNVAAYIDPTTVRFESLDSPNATRVIEQSFEFDLVSTEKLMERYVDEVITVDQLTGDRVVPITGTLLSTQGGLVLGTDDGQIHAIRNYENVHFPSLPGGLMTRPTLVWDLAAESAGSQRARITYQTSGITWWADYNVVFTEGSDANSGMLDVGAWVSILNRSGATYADARLKLIAGDVNRAQPPPQPVVMRALESAAADAGFAEQSFFEFHLYTLGRATTIAADSTKQIELFPQVRGVPAKKLLVYQGLAPSFGYFPNPAIERDLGLPMNTKVDVYLELENAERAGLGMPLPAGRIRVSQLDVQDDTLEFIGEDVIDHTPKDETVSIGLGSAFDVVGERRQVEFSVDQNGRRMEETIEIEVRNHKEQPVDVIVRETLFRWAENDVVEASHRYERLDARTVHFPITVAADGETAVRYRVRYRW